MKCSIILCLSCLFWLPLAAQDSLFTQEVMVHCPAEPTTGESLPETKKASSEYQLGLNWAFVVYKGFFSSQDGSNCTFHPSCSQYSVLAIQKKGPVLGMLLTFDRLTRCHGLSSKHYHVHESGLLKDPVE